MVFFGSVDDKDRQKVLPIRRTAFHLTNCLSVKFLFEPSFSCGLQAHHAHHVLFVMALFLFKVGGRTKLVPVTDKYGNVTLVRKKAPMAEEEEPTGKVHYKCY